MKVLVRHALRLLQELGKKTDQPLDNRGLKNISDQIKGVGERYLYEGFLRGMEKAKSKGLDYIDLQAGKLELIAKYLGYASFQQVIDEYDSPLDKILISLVGNYYSYVRRNMQAALIFQSPVRVSIQNRSVVFELKGPERMYRGLVEFTKGCLFILMKESGGKQIHHVYKIGAREQPQVLQGIFSGVSTAFEPIGGRTVLVRSQELWDDMKNREWKPSSWRTMMPQGGKELAAFLNGYEENNLSVNKVVTFTFADLQSERVKS